jgi:hypothetical protein
MASCYQDMARSTGNRVTKRDDLIEAQINERSSPGSVIPSRREESPREAQTRAPVSASCSNEVPRAMRERLRRAIPRSGSE